MDFLQISRSLNALLSISPRKSPALRNLPNYSHVWDGLPTPRVTPPSAFERPAGVRRLKHLHHLALPLALRVLKCGDAVAVGDVGAGAGRQQQAHDLDMARAAIAQDHGL